MRRNQFYTLLCLTFILGVLVGIIYINNINYQLYSKLFSTPKNHLNLHDGTDNDIERSLLLPTNVDGSPNVEKILNSRRVQIKTELRNYNFKYSGVQKLEDLLTESGGKPVRNIIVSAWRSGSTFTGELLNAMPSNFYHYEPLLKYNIKQIRGPPNADKALCELKNMLRCNYSGMEDYFEHGKKNLNYLNQFKHNRRLWDHCKYDKSLCFDPHFTAKFCTLFPFQSMKLVRFRLRLVKDLLEDTELNVKVVLLVRDPRGVMQSRRYRNFCIPAPDCSNPELVCADMVSDYAAATRLSQEYPGRTMALRFEELALNLNKTVPQLLKFLRLGTSPSINEFLQTHTNVEATEKTSTFRVTGDVPFKWKKVLDFNYVQEIQEACIEAMKLWGYKPAVNPSDLASEDFYPLEPLCDGVRPAPLLSCINLTS